MPSQSTRTATWLIIHIDKICSKRLRWLHGQTVAELETQASGLLPISSDHYLTSSWIAGMIPWHVQRAYRGPAHPWLDQPLWL
jgi:hypothetical protein